MSRQAIHILERACRLADESPVEYTSYRHMRDAVDSALAALDAEGVGLDESRVIYDEPFRGKHYGTIHEGTEHEQRLCRVGGGEDFPGFGVADEGDYRLVLVRGGEPFADRGKMIKRWAEPKSAAPLPGQSPEPAPSAGLREAAAEVVKGITALTPDSYCVRVPRSAWQALRAALRAERDEAKAAANEASTALADALARVEALEAALLECAQDLASEVNHAYGVHREPVHPSQQWKYERDMEPVARARALLEQKP